MFLKTLQGVRQGAVIDELNQKLYDLGLAVRSTGRAGELVLKLKLAPIDQSGLTLHIEDTVVVKEPKLSKGKTVFFVTDDGQLVRNDPRQKSLELRQVPAPEAPQEMRSIS